MRTNLLILTVFVSGIMGMTYFLNQPARIPAPDTLKEEPATVQAENYPPAPDLSLTSLSGQTMMLSDFHGKIILLNFWASWCVPCVVEFPQFLELAEKEPDRLVFLAVSVDSTADNIDQFIERLAPEAQTRLKLPNVHIIHDPDKKISQDVFQTVRYPETLVIGPDLTLREKIIGASEDFSSEEFRTRLMKKIHE